MGLDNLPEKKFARKIIAKHSLRVPFDLEKLVKEYANLVYKPIPIEGVDGVSLNLKVPGKTPTIVLNTNIPKTRRLFTLAHELGHVIIPWHLGTIIDDIYNDSYKDYLYTVQEQEANRFASELLMPIDWVFDEFKNYKDDLATLHRSIVAKTGVSDHAGAIRLVQVLPPHIIYTAEQGGDVLHTGSTDGTDAFVQEDGSKFIKDFYPYADSYTIYRTGSAVYHWWKLSTKITIEANDHRTWQEILNDIAKDIQPIDDIEHFKKSVNGIMSFAHGKTKMQNDYSVDSVVAACVHRLRRSGLDSLVNHRDFEKLVKIRSQAFFLKKRK